MKASDEKNLNPLHKGIVVSTNMENVDSNINSNCRGVNWYLTESTRALTVTA